MRLWVEMNNDKLQQAGEKLSASSWGCELKYLADVRQAEHYSQPLREAVSWNTTMKKMRSGIPESASSWGCELKYLWLFSYSSTSLSASSWGCELKYQRMIKVQRLLRQPLREAVSWNVPSSISTTAYAVSLFVRLWVEIPLEPYSEWLASCQPLREAVSWNANLRGFDASDVVSLFVRLWVEIPALYNTADIVVVSLFVRLWVEIEQIRLYTVWMMSASSWGCELKLRHDTESCARLSVSLFVRLWVEMLVHVQQMEHPYVSLFVRLWVEITAKISSYTNSIVSLFVRLWVEMLKAVWTTCRPHGQPLREAVSWNTESAENIYTVDESASSWGCELKCIICCDVVTPIFVSLFVRLLVEITVEKFSMSDIRCQPLREAVSWNTNNLTAINSE